MPNQEASAQASPESGPLRSQGSARCLAYLITGNLAGRTLFYAVVSRALLASAAAALTWGNVQSLLGHACLVQLLVGSIVALVGVVLLGLGLSRVSTVTVCLLETLVWLFTVVDFKVYRLLGLHLDNPVIVEAMQNPQFSREVSLGLRTLLSLGLLTLIVAGAQALVLAATRWLSARRARGRETAPARRRLWAMSAGLAAVAATTALACSASASRHGAHAAGSEALAALPLVDTLRERRGPGVKPSVEYPDHPEPLTPTQRPSILLILVESLRWDVVTPELTPNIARFRSSHSCISSRRHYSGAHTTEYGVFSLLYGLDGYHYTPFADAKIRSWPLEQLRQNGYRLHGTSASVLRQWNRGAFMVDQLDDYQEFLAGSNDRSDALMVEAIEKLAASPAARDPLVLFTFFASTHANYSYPPEFEIDKPVLPQSFDFFQDDDVLQERSAEIFNRYKNSVRYVDHLVGRVLAAFRDDLAAGRLIVFLSGDHGEEFWDHGKLGHASQRFYDARTRVPSLFCIPGVERTVELSSHVDVWPTIFEHLQGAPVDASRFSNGRSMLSPEPERQLVITGSGFPDRSRKLALVTENGKLWLSRKAGSLDRFDLINATDPDDRPITSPGRDGVPEARLRESMRRFLRVPGVTAD